MLGKRGFFISAAAVASLLSSAVVAQTLGQAPHHEISAWRVLLALLTCCVLGFAGALALRYRLKTGGHQPASVAGASAMASLAQIFRLKPKAETNANSRLQLLETVNLSHQVDVSLLSCDGATVLMVTSAQGAFVINPDSLQKSAGHV